MEPQYLTLNSLCKWADVHPNSGERYIRTGDLTPVMRVANIRLFHPDDVPKLKSLVAAGRARRGRKGK